MAHEDTRDREPQPRPVEWEKPYLIFDGSDISNFRQAFARLSDYDFLGIDKVADIEGYGAEGFPTANTKLQLPDGTVVGMHAYASTMAQIHEDTSGRDRVAPWGGEVHAPISATGGFNLTSWPLRLSCDWEKLESDDSPVATATISANGVDVLFRARVWSDPDEAVQEGGLQPASIRADETAITFLPGSADFLAGMAVIFHDPAQSSAAADN